MCARGPAVRTAVVRAVPLHGGCRGDSTWGIYIINSISTQFSNTVLVQTESIEGE